MEKKKSIKKGTTKRKKINKEEIYEDGWMYVLLLSTLVILISSVGNYKFTIGTTSITYAIFILPLIYFLANYITKKYGYRRTIVAISASSVALVLFNVIMCLIIGKNIDLVSLSSEFSGYLISQLINLTIYYFLMENTTSPIILVYLTYMFSLLVNYMFYTLISLNIISINGYWVGYFITIGFQAIICLPLAFIDTLMKKGIDYN